MAHQLPEFTDKANIVGISNTLTIPAGQIIELKVGASTLEDREFIEWQAIDTGIKWGLENSVIATSADAFKNQLFTRPFGENIKVYARNTKGASVKIFVAEVG